MLQYKRIACGLIVKIVLLNTNNNTNYNKLNVCNFKKLKYYKLI